MHRTSLVLFLALTACGQDGAIESARKKVLAIDPDKAREVIAFCKSWHEEGVVPVSAFPSALPAEPTTATMHDGELSFEWWNNDHSVEDKPHPGFVLTCSEHAVQGARPLVAGLWYRDAPMNSGD